MKRRNEIKNGGLRDNLPRIANFWRVGVLEVVLSEYLNKSHNFTNSFSMTSHFGTLFMLDL